MSKGVNSGGLHHTKSDEELGVVRVLGSVVGHGNYTTMGESESWMDLIFKGL